MVEKLTTVEAAAEFGPNWCLFWGERVARSQFEIWLPYVRRSRNRYAVMSGHDEIPPWVVEQVAGLPNVAVLDWPNRSWLRASRGFRGFLYIVNRHENFSVVSAFPRHAHVWLGHGDSEKKANAFRTVSLYDAVMMARYSNVRRFPRAVRRSAWHAACATGATIVEGATKDPWTDDRRIRAILYAPTWEGKSDRVDYSSLPVVAPILTAAMPGLAERGVRVIMRAHPGTGTRRPERSELVKALAAAGVETKVPKAEAFGAADVMISDISGVTGEFLFTEKPNLMPVWPSLANTGKSRASLERDYPWTYPWDIEHQDLAAALASLEGSDPLRPRRAAAARWMFRGHRSLEDAVKTFDLALTMPRWRKLNVPLRFVFEPAIRLPWLARFLERRRRRR